MKPTDVMKSLKWIFIAGVIIAMIIAGGVLYHKWQKAEEATRVRIYEAKIADISPMLRLCSVEIEEDLPIKASVGKRHLFAKMTVTGSISFDVENPEIEERGDTLIVTLPREIIDIRESTAPDSYRVIDSWRDGFFGKAGFSAAEENQAKSKVRDNYRKSLYSRGIVSRARAEAARNLTTMLHAATGKEVIVKN